MAGVDREGGEDGEDVLAEGFSGPGEAGFIQCGDRAEKDVFLGEGREEGFVEQIVLVGDHALDPLTDGGEGFAGAEAVGPVGVAAVFQQLFEGGDADFEELVEVGADDGEELEPFQEGLGGILGLLEDPLVEFQPAELAVEVVRHRWWIAQKGSKIEPIVGKAFRCFGLSHGGKFGVW